MSEPVVAFLGTGAMGAPMVRNLLRSGLEVRVWNRTPERALALEAEGAVACATPSEAASGADVLVTMLADGPSVDAATTGVLRPGLLWLQMATVGVSWTHRLAARAEEAGTTLVDAPVLGSLGPAAAGELVVLASGPDVARPGASRIFDVLGRETRWLGEVGAGSAAKLVLNFWILAQTTVVGEAIALAEALGVGAEAFLDVVRAGFADAPYAVAKAGAMLERRYEDTLFRLALARKDAALAAEAARGAGLELPVADAVVREMDRAIEAGYGDGDFAAVVEAARPER